MENNIDADDPTKTWVTKSSILLSESDHMEFTAELHFYSDFQGYPSWPYFGRAAKLPNRQISKYLAYLTI